MITRVSEKIGEAMLKALESIPVVRKLVSTQFRLKAFVCFAVLIASYISFNATYLVVSSIYRHSFIKNADEVSDAVSQQMHNSMLQLMEKGWTRDELNEFLESAKGMRGQLPLKVEIFRGEAVEKDYGRIEQPAMGRNIVDSFQTGDAITFKPYPLIINIYPIKAEDRCLKCHAHARAGEVLGVMKIQQDISPAINEAKRKFNVFFFMLLPIPFIMAGAVATLLNAKIKRSTGFFHDKVSEINSVRDLTKLNNFNVVETGFAEFNTILLEFTSFAKRIKGRGGGQGGPRIRAPAAGEIHHHLRSGERLERARHAPAPRNQQGHPGLHPFFHLPGRRRNLRPRGLLDAHPIRRDKGERREDHQAEGNQ